MKKDKSKKTLKEFLLIKKEFEKQKRPRLAAEGWDEDWKTLIAIILSAQNRDSLTIKVCENLFKKYKNAKELAEAPLKEIEKNIKSINYYKTKAKNIKETSRIISSLKKFPDSLEELIKLPGVGRKTANVFLAERRKAASIGVDTHVARISRKMGWTKNKNPKKIEEDLMKIFPKKYWNKINYILVGFGQTIGKSRKKEDKVLKRIKIYSSSNFPKQI
ncbi:MAG: endonuclease III [Candidatus Pacearchaeota archaeon]